ncbi:swr complex subunit [Maudiozyma exigua]|uniref:SWR1-complex protein 4 n=1 Tax=Maudiozyma exigua TaxID=34358 RepID=A0A9P6WFW2_MAUEX|nr:swr complex subunit [Kazachstania exigua]
MSSSDIFDVLNIKQKGKSPSNDLSPSVDTSGPSSVLTPGSLGSRAPKPQVTGMQRELYNLLGDNQPSMIVQPTNKFKESLKNVTKPSPWTQARFKANKRLVLRHWVKGSKDLHGEEPQVSAYAKYDQHMSLPEFTREEYESFMLEPEKKKLKSVDEDKKNEKLDEKKNKKDEKDDKKDEKLDEKVDDKDKTKTEDMKDDKKDEKLDEKLDEKVGDKDKTKADDMKDGCSLEGTNGELSESVPTEQSTEKAEEENKDNSKSETGEKKDNETDTGEKKDSETGKDSTTDNGDIPAENTDTEVNKNETNTTQEQPEVTTSKEEPQSKEWTYEEVEYLFNLCRTYDLRWFVISDRYNFNGITRTTEELKNEFYMVSSKYFQSKNAADSLLASLEYPLEMELERKKYLERLLSRSAAEIAEEEALIIESRKFEMGAKKMLVEREALLRLLDSPNSDKSVAQYLTSQGISQLYSSLLADKTRKRKHDSNVPENLWMKQQQQFVQQKQQLQQLHDRKPDITSNNATTQNHKNKPVTATPTVSSTASSSVPAGSMPPPQPVTVPPSGTTQKRTKKQKLEQQTAQKRKTEVAYAENLLKDFNEEQKKSLGISMHGEKLTPGVYLRSTKISTFKPALQNKVYGVLQELKLPVRPAMPSQAVVAKQEELLKQIVTLIELKKNLDKLEAEKAVSQ